MNPLDKREEYAYTACDLEGKTLRAAGKVLGVTPERVRQLRNRARGKLRRAGSGGA